MRTSSRSRFTKYASKGLALGLFALTLAGKAEAFCQNGSATQTVLSGNLSQFIESSSPPCVLTVGPGTWAPQTTALVGAFPAFFISTGITVKSRDGAALTTLSVAAGSEYAVAIRSLISSARIPDGAVLDGFTITGARGGVLVQDINNVNTPAGTLKNITLRNLIINTDSGDATLPGAHGISFEKTSNSVIDSCTLGMVRNNGIYLSTGSNNNLIINNTLAGTVLQNTIAIQGSDGNQVIGNTINGSGATGIILNRSAVGQPGVRFSRIEKNRITGYEFDAITVTHGSSFNYVGQNFMKSSKYDPITQPTALREDGSGLWLNNQSNGNFVFTNDSSGTPETGFPIFVSSNNYLVGNLSHANRQGGIYVSDDGGFTDGETAVAPSRNVLHSNYGYFNGAAAMINLRGASNNDVAYNYLSGTNSPGGTLSSTATGGLAVERSSNTNFYENFVTDVDTRVYVYANSTSSTFFRNRFLNGSNNPTDPVGKRGLTYSLSNTTATWDKFYGEGKTGGNHWSDFASSANPSRTTQYKGFIYDGVHSNDGKGPYIDHHPFQSESLGSTVAVTVDEPIAGQIIAAGSKKTIRWRAPACVLVTIKTGSTTIASNFPNIGFYMWDVPSGLTTGAKTVTVECLTSSGASTGVTGASGSFTTGTSDLILLTPGRDYRAVPGTLRVAWKKTAAVTAGVNVLVNGTQVATAITDNFTDINLPVAVTSSNNVNLRIVASNNANQQDSVDGTFMVRSTAAFTTDLTNANLIVGSILPFRWIGTGTTYYADVDLMEGAFVLANLATNLPDFGQYTWSVPEMWSSGARLRVTLKDTAGTTVTTIFSGTFRISYSTAAGSLVTRYRLYSPITLEHLFTTDQNEYNTLNTFTGVWQGEGADHAIYNGPANQSGVEAVPYYRLYDKTKAWHHWTTDRNEYFTLRGISGIYDAEGVDGYVLPTSVPSTVTFYRLVFSGLAGLHHWTRDANERSVLTSAGGWVDENQNIFVSCPSSSPRPCP
jgi:hypothetical protein